MGLLGMKKLVFVFFVGLVISSCDLGEDCSVVCVPGAPEFVLQITPGEELDSSFLQYEDWAIFDPSEEVKVRLNEDPGFQANGALFMDVLVNDSSILVYGGGVTWNHRSNEETYMIIDYGNEVKDTFDISLEIISSECCSAYNVSGLSIDGESLERDSVRSFYQYVLKE